MAILIFERQLHSSGWRFKLEPAKSMRQQHHKNITLNLFILRNLTIPEYTAITPTYRYSHVHCASQQLTWSKIGSEVRAKHQPYLCGTTPDRPSFVHDPTS
jgi:hypothetical protein